MTVGGKEMKGELLKPKRPLPFTKASSARCAIPACWNWWASAWSAPGFSHRAQRRHYCPHDFNPNPAPKRGPHSLNIPLRSSRMWRHRRPSLGEPGPARLAPLRSVYSPTPRPASRTGLRATLVTRRPPPTGPICPCSTPWPPPRIPFPWACFRFGRKARTVISCCPCPRVRAPEGEVVPKDVVFILTAAGAWRKAARWPKPGRPCRIASRPWPRRTGSGSWTSPRRRLPGQPPADGHPANRARALRYVERLKPPAGLNIEASWTRACA